MKRRLIILVLMLCLLVQPVLIFSSELYSMPPSFEGNPRSCGAPPCCVTFTNFMTGGTLPYNSATWDFGDGTTPVIQIDANAQYGATVTHCYQKAGVFDVTLTMEDAVGLMAYQVEFAYITVGEGSTEVELSFYTTGFFPKHLPDSYAGQVVLSDLDPAEIPDDIQGIYWYDCSVMEWKFWAPGAPGCTLSTLGGGHTFDYLVSVTGPCDWKIPVTGEIPTPLQPPSESYEWRFCNSGFFAKHLPDGYISNVVLADLVDVPSKVQGVYWHDGNEWLFWAPGAPGCTLPILGGGHKYDYMVAVTGDCDWSIPLSMPIPLPTPSPTATPTPTPTPTPTTIPPDVSIGNLLQDYYDNIRETEQGGLWAFLLHGYQADVDFAANMADTVFGYYWPDHENAYYQKANKNSYIDAMREFSKILDYLSIDYSASNTEKIERILNFMKQYIHYEHDISDRSLAPFETLAFRSGDCEDYSILAAALFKAVGIDSAVAFFRDGIAGHAMVLVHLNDIGPHNYYSYSDLTDKGLQPGQWIIIEPQSRIEQQRTDWIARWGLLAAAELSEGIPDALVICDYDWGDKLRPRYLEIVTGRKVIWKNKSDYNIDFEIEGGPSSSIWMLGSYSYIFNEPGTFTYNLEYLVPIFPNYHSTGYIHVVP